MNKQDFSEIRRRFNYDKNAISCIRGCYVSEKGEIVSTFNHSFLSLPQEEAERYLTLFKRALTGVPGKNLVPINFRPDQIVDGEAHQLLTALRNTALKVDSGVETLYEAIIQSVDLESNPLILLMHDAYDLPYHSHDEFKVDDASEEVFNYIVCSICPVKLTKPALSYYAEDQAFHECEQNWVVGAPELGFMFPAYEDHGANICSAVYFTRDTETPHDDFVNAIFDVNAPMPADEQRDTFMGLLEETVETDLDYTVIQSISDCLREKIEAQKADKTAEAPVITKRDVRDVLQTCGVTEEHIQAFDTRFDDEFGQTADLMAQNLLNERKFEVRTPDVVINVKPDRSDLIETRVIDGFRYIMIRADDGVTVNGVNIAINNEE
ncbi:MAG: DUF4317 domain-containing protein [Clostridia bacterium]|nr:DUF4317 domain-containing protein [Clostridia bacterium]